MSQLALLGNLAPDDPTLPKFAQTIDDYIGSTLLDAPAILHRTLSPGIPLAGNVTKATSRALAAGTRVFDPGEQAQVEAVYNYFAVYQAQARGAARELLALQARHLQPRDDSAEPRPDPAQRHRAADCAQAAAAGRLLDRSGHRSHVDAFTIDGSSRRALPAFIQGYCGQGSHHLESTRFAASTTVHQLAARVKRTERCSRRTSDIIGSARVYLNAQLGYDGPHDCQGHHVRRFDSVDASTTVGYRAYRDQQVRSPAASSICNSITTYRL